MASAMIWSWQRCEIIGRWNDGGGVHKTGQPIAWFMQWADSSVGKLAAISHATQDAGGVSRSKHYFA